MVTDKRHPRRNGNGPETNRWWFSRGNDEEPRSAILARANGGQPSLVIFRRNPIILLTEKQVSGKFGSGAESSEAKSFAADFTAYMNRLGRQYDDIGQRLHLYRLLDVMLHIKEVAEVDPPGLDFWVDGYKTDFRGPPEKLPTLSRDVSTGARYRL
jgi:hypothetical protein